MIKPLLRRALKLLNGGLMVPGLKMGLARWVVSPYSGYIMLLKTKGRKSGLARYSPLNYAIEAGSVYCLAGFGEGTHWLANLRADPHVEVILPDRALSGLAEEVEDPEEAARIGTSVARNAGFAVLFEGLNPFTITDEELRARLLGRPVVRIRPTGVAAGPHDPGGHGWIPLQLLQMLLILWAVARLIRGLRLRARAAASP